LNPESEAILGLYKFEEEPDNEAEFRFSVISDRRLVDVISHHLENGTETEKRNKRDDQNFREHAVVSFYDQVRKTVRDYDASCLPLRSLPKSECWRVVASELTYLVKTKADEKYIIVYSDLRENSTVYNVYDTSYRRLVVDSACIVADSFIKAATVPHDLKGIHVVFAYKPANRYLESPYLEMIALYRFILLRRGASVSVVVSNNFTGIK
jgi:hypothetical protein